MTRFRLAVSVCALACLTGSPALAQRAAPVAAARSEAPLAPLTADQRAAAVARIKQIVQERYVFPDRVPAILARLDQGLASGRYDEAVPRTFADRLTDDLRESSGDRHMYVNVDPAQYAAAISGPAEPEARNPVLEALWERGAVRGNHGLSDMRLLPGNVRYLRITQFHWVDDRTGEAYDEAARFLREGDAVIIDIRNNGGGSHGAVRYFISHFMDGNQLEMTFLQSGEAPSQSRTLEYLPSGRIKGKPVYVLINANVGSAAEAFAYDMQQFHLGTLVGSRTAGAANNNAFEPVAPAFMLSVSFGRPVHPVSGGNWEAVGLSPDVAAPDGQELDTAQALALAALEARPDANPADRADWEWARIGIEARLHPVTIPVARLRALAGDYQSRRILFADGVLLYRRTNGQTARLTPLTADGLFAVEGFDDRFRVRLTGDALESQWISDSAPIRFPRS